MFNHVNHGIEMPKLKQVTLPSGKRTYATPEGNVYPSVTTVLSAQPKPELEKWKKRVGEEEAKRISKRATTHGTMIHSMAENYLNNVPNWNEGYSYFDIHHFDDMKKHLNKTINNVWLQEVQMYSDYLATAGTVDCIAEYEGVLSIIDFKTSRIEKKREWITDYFIQEAAYSIMFEERTGKPIRQLVTIITSPDSVQTFIEDRDDWIDDFIRMRKEYISGS